MQQQYWQKTANGPQCRRFMRSNPNAPILLIELPAYGRGYVQYLGPIDFRFTLSRLLPLGLCSIFGGTLNLSICVWISITHYVVSHSCHHDLYWPLGRMDAHEGLVPSRRR